MNATRVARVMLCVGCFGLASCSSSSSDAPPVANCDLVCDTVSVCGVESEGECLSGCGGAASEASGISSACSDDFAALNACLGGLNCDQLGDWALMEPPDSYPCRTQTLAVAETCGDLDGIAKQICDVAFQDVTGYIFCGAGGASCTFYYRTADTNTQEITCASLCGPLDCKAYNEVAEGSCTLGEEISCDQEGSDAICECSLAAQ